MVKCVFPNLPAFRINCLVSKFEFKVYIPSRTDTHLWNFSNKASVSKTGLKPRRWQQTELSTSQTPGGTTDASSFVVPAQLEKSVNMQSPQCGYSFE